MAAALLALTPGRAGAAPLRTLYVDPAGDDEADGSAGRPWRTGIVCSVSCSSAYGVGISVTLTAAPAPGSTFAGWSGACAGTAACALVLDQARAVTARFTRVFADPC